MLWAVSLPPLVHGLLLACGTGSARGLDPIALRAVGLGGLLHDVAPDA